MDDGRTTFLFWNVGQFDETVRKAKRIENLLPAIVREQAVDVVLLAECTWSDGEAEAVLSSDDDRWHSQPAKAALAIGRRGQGLRIVSRWPRSCHQEVATGYGYRIQKLLAPGGLPLLLVLAHLPMARDAGARSQELEAKQLAAEIAAQERNDQPRHTVLAGDLNFQPFADPLIRADVFNAVMCRRVALEEKVKVKGVQYPLFFNPMWRLLGGAPPSTPGSHFAHGEVSEADRDEASEALGTYFSRAGVEFRYYWYMHDQVLLRPALLKDERFRDEDLWLVTGCQAGPLLDKLGRPSKTVASDHLPVVFRLDLRRSDNG